jgi:hypothetical protein
MKLTLITILFAVSVLVNIYFGYDHLQRAVYKQGIKVGIETMNRQITDQVAAGNNIKVKLPNGSTVALVPQQQVKPNVPGSK